MGGGVFSFGLCVVLVCVLRNQNAVKADPIPADMHYDLCSYLRLREHRGHGTTTVAPKETKPKEEKDKVDLFKILFREFLELEKNTDKKKEEEKKKKEDEEKKKKEEEEKKKKEKEAKKEEPKGFQSINDFWDNYIKFLTALYYSF